MSTETAWRNPRPPSLLSSLDVVNVDFLLAATLSLARVAVVAGFIGCSCVLAGRLHHMRFVCSRLTRVFHNDVALLVLVVAQTQQDDVTLVDPDLLPQLAADMGETARAVEALGFKTSVSEHLDDLSVFLALLLEDELALLVVVLVLTPTPVLTTLLSLLALWSRMEEHARSRGRCRALRLRVCLLPHGCGQRHRVVRRGGAAPPPRRRVVRTFPLFFGILSSSWGCLDYCGWVFVW
jgi:hypothetical protein